MQNQVSPPSFTKHVAKNPIRVVTAASLFDGHDASINIIRRILQDFGAEVIHLGHNRSVFDVVQTAVQEGAQGICVSSYQGGHIEYFKFMKDLLDHLGAGYVRVFGGGGGVIIHDEKKELERYGIAQIFHPDDGRRLGLEGMINMIIEQCDFSILEKSTTRIEKPHISKALSLNEMQELDRSFQLGRLFSSTELKSKVEDSSAFEKFKLNSAKSCLVLGITGTGGAGKSSLIDELVQRFLNNFTDKKIGIFCVDPSKKKTGGALLGDRIRMNSLTRAGAYMRSLASRGSGQEISESLKPVLQEAKNYFDLVIAETSGIGQGNTAITNVCDFSLYVMTSEFGAQSQLEKIDMIDFADFIAVNKSDRRGAQDALRDVSKQYRRSRKIFDNEKEVPVYLTRASQFNDHGVHQLFLGIVDFLNQKQVGNWTLSESKKALLKSSPEHVIIPTDRQNYLSEIVKTIRDYKSRTKNLAESASQIYALDKVEKLGIVTNSEIKQKLKSNFTEDEWQTLNDFEKLQHNYAQDTLSFFVRGKEIKQPLTTTSLSGTVIRKVCVPKISDWGDRFKYLKLENVPGEFPYTAGVFPLKRPDEDPKRMFAGEGTPERTNARFHYLCKGEMAHRLSTAFDSVTLYGHDPDLRPDIYGKVGESGVSICTLTDMKKLYHGFDLCSPNTSVSMTINGPAPMILAYFFNTAYDQQVEKKTKELGRDLNQTEKQGCFDFALANVRGTVQADILKEDQGQNTCIFSTTFALKMMGDIQEYFVKKNIKNFYSVSISGYHIAEAGANPISQLAFTLSNGFTFVEYYLSRGLKIDEFAHNLSFFFSNGLDPEYTVLGRVARRIWAIAMKELYGANDRSQKLKYHIQTSGRSLHAQEIDFNDIRTTLQALIAIYDNCNSLHTNAFDEAITTPTQESVRRAMAIQLIINREFGLTKNENPLQGSYFVEELTELVEEAVLSEFSRINERGGVLGAMETHYQRSKIQEESMHYEHLKHSGELPIIGVNTFIDPKTLDPSYVPAKIEMARASQAEKNQQLENVDSLKQNAKSQAEEKLNKLKTTAMSGGNIFESLIEASRECSLYQMTQALYEVGGQYRRNL